MLPEFWITAGVFVTLVMGWAAVDDRKRRRQCKEMDRLFLEDES